MLCGCYLVNRTVFFVAFCEFFLFRDEAVAFVLSAGAPLRCGYHCYRNEQDAEIESHDRRGRDPIGRLVGRDPRPR